MAKVLIDLDDADMLEWAQIITEALGTDAPKDIDDALAIVYDAIMVDRKRLTEHILDRRERLEAAAAIKTAVDRVTMLPTRKVAVVAAPEVPLKE
jgi:phosphoglycerate dehydrogenase-like enzyme